MPKEAWICDFCVVSTGADYGFEEGNEHSFVSFQKRTAAFRRKWLELYPPPETENAPAVWSGQGEDWLKEIAIEDHMEREFWRLVESPNDTIEVEYGADIHTSKWGR